MTSKHYEKNWEAAAETLSMSTIGFNSVSIHQTSVGGGATFSFAGSNDQGATWTAIHVVSQAGVRTSTITAAGFYFIPALYDVVRMTADALTDTAVSHVVLREALAPMAGVSGGPEIPVAISAELDAAGIEQRLGDTNETTAAADNSTSGLNGLIKRALAHLTSGFTLTGAVTETAPASDTASSGLNGRLQRIAQRLTSLIALVPASLGVKTSANSFAIVTASDDAIQGGVTETAPASDTASSGHNGRLQRIAQRLTSLIALLPTSLGTKTSAASLSTVTASDDAIQGAVNETAPASDTASAGHNGRLQRIAQRLTSLIALLPTSLGQKTAAASLSVVNASDDPIVTAMARPGTGTATQVNDTASAGAILASNANRKGAEIWNDSTEILYLLLSATGTVSATVCTAKVMPDDSYVIPRDGYTGVVNGVWAANASGAARVTEWT